MKYRSYVRKQLISNSLLHVPPSYVKRAAEEYGGWLTICTVIGFPFRLPYYRGEKRANQSGPRDGADEIDMAFNNLPMKNGEFDKITKRNPRTEGM